ncbi:MAG TPA: antibiotic biosynthesis monooxygenase [Verrucomicrobiae bacterium]|nr:antibiotic biosynthesis monooxygenase [Verrucomicrobiae bacterium]
MNYYQHIGKFTAKAGKQDALRDILLQAAQALESNTDCQQYIVSTDTDSNTVWVTELWRDKATHDVALTLAETKALIQQALPLIESMDRVAELQTEGGKGL